MEHDMDYCGYCWIHHQFVHMHCSPTQTPVYVQYVCHKYTNIYEYYIWYHYNYPYHTMYQKWTINVGYICMQV